MHLSPRTVAVIAAVVLLGGCAAPPPSAGPSGAPTPTPGPSTPAAPPTPIPASGPPAPDFTTIVVTDPDQWRPGEIFLLSGFRIDTRFDCGPRRESLPPGATGGVECAGDEGPAERVGAYLFPDAASARAAYEARLAENGLDPAADGGCPMALGSSPEDPSAPRSACFLNDQGVANLRILWPAHGVMVGVLGRDGDVDDLDDWSRGQGNPGARTPIDVWRGGLGGRRFEACDGFLPPAPTTTQLEVVFSDDGLWLSDPDGGRKRRLAAQGSAPSWSPDGRHLAYVADAEVHILDVESGGDRVVGVVELFGLGEDAPIGWSPDGSRLAYVAPAVSEDKETSVWTTGVDGGRGRKVLDGAFVAWSPDGRLIAVRREDRLGPMFVVDVDERSAVQVGVGSSAAWSSDCRHLAVEGDADDGIVVYDGAGFRPRLAMHGRAAAWSPVGDEIAFQDTETLRVVGAGGDGLRSLGTGGDPIWSTAGSRLAFTSFNAGEGIGIVNADGSGRTPIGTADHGFGILAWSPDDRFILSFQVFRGETCAGTPYTYVAAVDGSGIRNLGSGYGAAWRPVARPGTAAEIGTDEPPTNEGCGG